MSTTVTALELNSPIGAAQAERDERVLESALSLAAAGFRIAPAKWGNSQSYTPQWQLIATTDPKQIKEWFKDHSQFAVVANRPEGTLIDIDRVRECKELGFRIEWLNGVKLDLTPGKGLHAFLPWHDAFSRLPDTSVINVCKDGKKILEWKLRSASVACPWAWRDSDPERHKEAGWYRPVTGHTELGQCPEPDALVDWVLAHSVAKTRHGSVISGWKFHPDFKDDLYSEFLDYHDCTYLDEGESDSEPGRYFVAVEKCPICCKPSHEDGTGSLAHARAKFMFGGRGYGYKCQACDAGKTELVEYFKEEYEDWKWDKPIYEGDDKTDEKLRKQAGWGEKLGAEDGFEPKPEAAEVERTIRTMEADAGEPPTPAAPLPTSDWWKETADKLDGVRTARRPNDDGKGFYKEERHIVEAEVFEYLTDRLKQRVEFLHDADSYLFLKDSKKIVNLNDGMEADDFLMGLRLFPTQPHQRFVAESLQAYCRRLGKKVEMGHWGVYRHGNVYVNNGRGGMFRITVTDITEVPNGTDDVYMHDPRVKPFPTLDGLDGMRKKVREGLLIGGAPLSEYLNATFEEQNCSPLQYRQLFLARYLGLFFRGAFSLLPICFATGEQGSGKSTLFEKVLWLVEGTDETANTMPKDERGLIGTLTHRHMAILDNVDGVKWDRDNSLDYICKASDGGSIDMAKLYATNTLKSYRLRCDLFLTARSNAFPEDRTDAGRRTLFFPFRKPTDEERITRDEMMERARLGRGEMLLETLVRLQLCLQAFTANAGKRYSDRNSEMPEFEEFTLRIADYEDWLIGCQSLWKCYMKDYRQSSTENSPLVGLIKVWLGSPEGRASVAKGDWVKASQVYAVVDAALKNRLGYKSDASFGKAMNSNLTALGYAFGAKRKFSHGYHLYRFSPTPELLAESEAKWRKQYDPSAGEPSIEPEDVR